VPYLRFVNAKLDAKLIRGLFNYIEAISHFRKSFFVNGNFFFPLCKIIDCNLQHRKFFFLDPAVTSTSVRPFALITFEPDVVRV
jgi:hypothetical protein